MQTITKHVVLLALIFSVQLIDAQDTIQNGNNIERIEALNTLKETIKNQERDFLKNEVEAINKKLDNKEISMQEAEKLKMEAAKKAALNIDNRIAIVDNQIALLERNYYGFNKETKQNLFGVNISNRTFNVKTKKAPVKYDIRTSNDLLFAVGFNNAIIDGESFDDSPYKKGGSGFVELGWNWKTRLLKNSNFIRFKYGFSLQWNKLNPKDNQYFLQNGNITELQQFPINLDKSKFRVTNLVVPIHFEFGPSKKLDKEDRIRYINNDKFKIGIGGYAGINIGTQQKLKYNDNGDKVKQKMKEDFNTNDFVYGLSGYIGAGDTALYIKYDLSPIFNDQAIKQNNISIGLRFDMD
jgi:hypothetical protein